MFEGRSTLRKDVAQTFSRAQYICVGESTNESHYPETVSNKKLRKNRRKKIEAGRECSNSRGIEDPEMITIMDSEE